MWWHTGHHTGRFYHVSCTYCSQTAVKTYWFVQTFVKKRRVKPGFLWWDGIPDTIQGGPTMFLVHISCFAPKLLLRRIFCRNVRKETAVKTGFLVMWWHTGYHTGRSYHVPTTFLVHNNGFAPKLLSRRIFCRNLRKETLFKTGFLAGWRIRIRIGSGFNRVLFWSAGLDVLFWELKASLVWRPRDR